MELQRGQSLGGYEIVSHVKSGGMAALYLARRRGAAGFQRPVAVKVVHPHLARDAKFVRMFLDEARLAVRIQHPNVVRVEELLEAEGTYLMVMEYVHGCSLYDLLRALAKAGRRLSPDLAAWIGMQIADGLHAAHELKDERGQPMDVVHRDVSPQNVLLSWDGHVKVIDFGIAKSRAQAERTRVGVIRGKVGYMSPEQANAGDLDRRTDVYALGVVLWEMVTSRRLFRADNEIRLLDMVRNPQIPKPSDHGTVPEPLEDAILEALRPDVRVRLPSAKALRDRLLQAQPGAGHVHSSNLAGLLATVLGDKIEDAPISWSEAFSVEQAHATASHLANHTMAASASLFSDELDEDDEPLPHPTAAQVPRRRVTTAPPPPPSAPRPPPPRPRVPTPVPTPSHSRPVLRPSASPPAASDRPNTFAQFSQPPPPDAPVPVPVAAKPPSTGAQLVVSLVSLLVLGGALALAGYLLWQAGAFEDLLNEGGDAAIEADGAVPNVVDAGL